MDSSVFFASEKLMLVTLGFVALLLVVMPFSIKGVERRLPSSVSTLYRKQAIETYIQTVLMLAPLVIATYNGLKNNVSAPQTPSNQRRRCV